MLKENVTQKYRKKEHNKKRNIESSTVRADLRHLNTSTADRRLTNCFSLFRKLEYFG